jgi:hypothetical protein
MSAATRRRPHRSRHSRGTLTRPPNTTAVPVVPVMLRPATDLERARELAATPPTKRHRLRSWVRADWLSLLMLAGLLPAVGLVHAIGYDRFPGAYQRRRGYLCRSGMGSPALAFAHALHLLV